MAAEFYIGYLDKAPSGVASHIKKVVVGLVVLTLFLAWLLASQQQGFASSTYQYAVVSEITGILSNSPVPAVKVYQGTAHGKPIIQSIPLVQFGKIGGQNLTKAWEEHLGSWVTIKGHLIYYDGKALLEVTDAGHIEPASPPKGYAEFTLADLHYDQTTFIGEIVDAKCYFGVMKPGHGKPHRACAIRCISGGIPAVLKVRDKLDRVNYHLISMKEGNGSDLASRIGEAVEIQGALIQSGDWSILTIANSAAITPLSGVIPDFSEQLTLCK